MSNSYEAKKTLVNDARLQVQELCLSYRYVGNATPANVVVTTEQLGVLFIQTESTSASGSTDIAALITSGETYTPAYAPHFNDLDGSYNILVLIGEKCRKVLSVEARNRKTGLSLLTTFQTAPAQALIGYETAGANDAIVFGVIHIDEFEIDTIEAILIVRYIVE